MLETEGEVTYFWGSCLFSLPYATNGSEQEGEEMVVQGSAYPTLSASPWE